MDSRAKTMRYRRRLGHGLDDTGFVVGEHQGDPLGLRPGARGFHGREVHDPGTVDGKPGCAGAGFENGRMFYRAHEGLRRVAFAYDLVVGLGASAGEHDLAGSCADQRRDALPRILDMLAGRPAACTEDAFPVSRNTSVSTSMTSGRILAVAL